jgi:RNA polymerase sigma factor (sigma-70 family)
MLAESGRLRALAAALVHGADADDVVQSTWSYALSHPPSDRRNLGAWLAAVARNVARQLFRSEGRRRARESGAARSPVADDTAVVSERMELRGRLVHAVLALPAEERTAVALRYFEDLPPAEIARRLELPASTVRSRIHRGLSRLRRRLEVEAGDETEGWVALALPRADRAPPRPWVSTLLAEGLLMTAKTKLLVAVALLLLGLVVWRSLERGSAPDTPVAPTSRVEPNPATVAEPSSPSPAGLPSPLNSGAGAAAEEETETAPPPETLRGRIVLSEGGAGRRGCRRGEPLLAVGRPPFDPVAVALGRGRPVRAFRAGGSARRQVSTPSGTPGLRGA